MNRCTAEYAFPTNELGHQLESRSTQSETMLTSRPLIWMPSGAKLKSLAMMMFTSFRVSRFPSPEFAGESVSAATLSN